MILTVTLNAALDVTYRLDRVAWGATNRVDSVTQRAGGKGVNVARVLHALAVDVLAGGLAGGCTGQAIRSDLAEAGLVDVLVPIDTESRRTVTVVAADDARTTVFSEPGPRVSAAKWTAFSDHYQSLVPTVAAVVLSGSLPPGVPLDAYGRLAESAARAGVPVVLDADGESLRLGLAGRPRVIKPNRDELCRVVGRELRGRDEILAAADQLREAGADAVVVSLGEDGLLARTTEGTWHARPPAPVDGNPTGAGDAAVAALTIGLVHDRPWPERLADAVALSAAAVRAPVAGDFDAPTYHALRGTIHVETL